MGRGANKNLVELKQTHSITRAPLRQRGPFQTRAKTDLGIPKSPSTNFLIDWSFQSPFLGTMVHDIE